MSRVISRATVLRSFKFGDTTFLRPARAAIVRQQSNSVRIQSIPPAQTPPLVPPMTNPMLASTSFYMRPLPSSCISFNSKEGKRIFGQALSEEHLESYFLLAGACQDIDLLVFGTHPDLSHQLQVNSSLRTSQRTVLWPPCAWSSMLMR